MKGKYGGAPRNSCNLLFRINSNNIRPWSFDVHLILSAAKPQQGDISVIPNTSEKYTSLTTGYVTFVDSFQFMPSSIQSLSDNLTDGQFKETMH